jgi:uncharacterized SAM-binding protein YcdF (DUF218 family)
MWSILSHGFLSPPTVFITLALIGAWLTLYRAPMGVLISLIAALSLYACATPVVASILLERLDAKVPTGTELSQAQAIVVLGGDLHLSHGVDEDALGPLSQQRVAYAAAAYRKLHLPVAVSGGPVSDAHRTEGALMRSVLETDYSVPITWVEDRSTSTYENALYTAQMLRPAGIKTVVVVTNAWHMPRALWCFERVGMHALPWPAPRDYLRADRASDYLPSMDALDESFHALHELLGLAYYRLHY